MITDKLQAQINKALKEGENVRVTTLRMLSSALHNAEIDNKREKLTKEQEMVIVKKEAKKRKDAIEIYEKGGAQEKADLEKKELEILKEFLPEEMGDSDLEKIVLEAIDQLKVSSMADMGKVIGIVMGKAKGQADGKRVSQMVKSKLSK